MWLPSRRLALRDPGAGGIPPWVCAPGEERTGGEGEDAGTPPRRPRCGKVGHGEIGRDERRTDRRMGVCRPVCWHAGERIWIRLGSSAQTAARIWIRLGSSAQTRGTDLDPPGVERADRGADLNPPGVEGGDPEGGSGSAQGSGACAGRRIDMRREVERARGAPDPTRLGSSAHVVPADLDPPEGQGTTPGSRCGGA
jgi:hypothetical protein